MLHFTDTGGNKPILLLVHGVLMNETTWHKQVAAFQSSHRVVTVDLAGFGRSPGTGAEMFPDHVAKIVEVLDHLGLEDVTFVGWSMGGAIGQVMGKIAPERLKRLVLFGTTPQLVADEAFPHALPPEAVEGLGGVFANDFAAGCAGFAETCAPGDPDTIAFLTGVMTRTDSAIGLDALGTGGAQSQIDMLSDIAVETYIIHGAEDAVCFPAAATYLAEQIAGCSGDVHWLNGAGHAAHLTHADEFNKTLGRCLK
jgi:pimeloyl-[acyl-carrier protein] methyl ester esterase